MELSELSIHAWLLRHDIKTEQGDPLDFKQHLYMFDIYSDFSPKQVWRKAAQVTASTCAIMKTAWICRTRKIDAIYTLPTESDRNTFVGGKVNRLVAQNPILQEWVKDKDSIEQKQIEGNIIHFRGTWSQKTATMVPSDLNVYDEVDTSKQDVIEQYSTRLQHSALKWEWYLSHPSAPDFGIDRYWQLSDQKHWFIKCPHCSKEQYLSWPESFDLEKEIYICKSCHKELSSEDRRIGRWVKKFKDREYSGYWIPLLLCPWVSAKAIIWYQKNKSEEYFYNKVLGMPFAGSGNKLIWEAFAQNFTNKQIAPDKDASVVIGVDTGLKIDYVLGNSDGLFKHGAASDYDELDGFMDRWPKAIAVVDAGGDLIGSRKFYEKWSGRVFLCHTGGDRKTMDLLRWGKDEEYGNVVADRNRLIQMVVDEFRDGRVSVHGGADYWHEYWLDWRNLTRVRIFDPVTSEAKGYKWIRSGRDHRAMATAYWRVGMDKYGFGEAEVVGDEPRLWAPAGPEIKPDRTIRVVTPAGEDMVEATMEQLREANQGDWRNT